MENIKNNDLLTGLQFIGDLMWLSHLHEDILLIYHVTETPNINF